MLSISLTFQSIKELAFNDTAWDKKRKSYVDSSIHVFTNISLKYSSSLAIWTICSNWINYRFLSEEEI
jgi:hypothetical protein